LQNKILHTNINFPRRAPTRELYVTFSVLYVYAFITILCRQQVAAVIQIHEHANVRNIWQTKLFTGSISGLYVAAVRFTIVQVT